MLMCVAVNGSSISDACYRSTAITMMGRFELCWLCALRHLQLVYAMLSEVVARSSASRGRPCSFL
jgi:hypothetical protein